MKSGRQGTPPFHAHGACIIGSFILASAYILSILILDCDASKPSKQFGKSSAAKLRLRHRDPVWRFRRRATGNP